MEVGSIHLIRFSIKGYNSNWWRLSSWLSSYNNHQSEQVRRSTYQSIVHVVYIVSRQLVADWPVWTIDLQLVLSCNNIRDYPVTTKAGSSIWSTCQWWQRITYNNSLYSYRNGVTCKGWYLIGQLFEISTTAFVKRQQKTNYRLFLAFVV